MSQMKRIGGLLPHLTATARSTAVKVLVAFCCLVGLVLLPAQFAGAATQAEAIVAAARSMESRGYPYCFDGGNTSGPTVGITDRESDGSYSNCASIGKVGFDCTGLTLYAVYQGTGNAGLSHDGHQARSGGGQTIGSTSALQPGDVVYFDYNAANGLNAIDHAGIYVGGGQVLSAVSEKWGIRTESIAWYEAGGLHFVGGVRYWSASGGGGGGSPPPPPLTTANLLTDGGFERGGEGWGTMGPAGATLNHVAYTNSSGHDGSLYSHDGSLYMEANTSAAGGSLYQDVPVNMQQGQSATFSMWVRLGAGATAAGQTAELCLWALSGGNVNACQSRTLTTEWQQLQATTTMPAQTGTLRAQVYMPVGVNVDFDGGVLSPNLLTDGGFEAGGQGWGTLGPAGATMYHLSYANSSAHDGARYMEANTNVGGGSLYQDVPVNMQQGQSATFSMWVRLGAGATAAGQTAELCLWALSGGNVNACQSRTLTTEWQQLQATTTMPAQTGTLRAQVYMPVGVNVDFDGGSLGAPQTAEPAYPSSSPAAGPAAASASAATNSGAPSPAATGHHRLRSAKACSVPRLRHKTLIAAKRALRHAHCRLGAVHRRTGHRGTRRVSGQSARAKSGHKHGYRVAVTLG